MRGIEYLREVVYDPKTQKCHDVLAKSERELAEKVTKKKSQLRLGVKDSKMRFGDLMYEWLRNTHYIDKKPKTIERYDSTWRNYIKDKPFAKIPVMKIDPEDIQDYYNEVFEEKGLASYVKAVNKLMSPFLRYLYNTGWTPRDYGAVLKVPRDTLAVRLEKQNKSDVRPMTLQEQMIFVEKINGHKLEALFRMATDTGLREGELFALTWSDVVISKKESAVSVRKTLGYVRDIDTGKYHHQIGPPKNVKSIRKVTIPKKTAEILTEYKTEQKKMLDRIGMKQSGNTLVFCTPIGTPLDSQNTLKRLKKVYAAMDITDKTFHDLRHTYATRLFELGEEVKTVSELLGHSNVNTTLSTYIHVLDALKVQTASKIDNLYA